MTVLPSLVTRPMAGTRLNVSVLGFGGAPLGGFRSDASDAEATETINAALDGGMTYFDTAPLYGYGRSEERLGRVLSKRARDSFVLSTKVGRVLQPLGSHEDGSDLRLGGLRNRPRFDFSYEGTIASWEQSKRRLGLGRIDVLYIHDVDGATHGGADGAQRCFDACMEGAVPALRDLRAAGEIGAFGVGLNDVAWSLRFVEQVDLDCVMIGGRYTLLDQAASDRLLPECRARGISLTIGGPFNSGILATGAVEGALYHYGPAPEDILTRVRQIKSICDDHAVALQAAALQFPLRHGSVCSVVAGADTAQSVAENLMHLRAEIPTALWSDLQGAGLIPRGAAEADHPTGETVFKKENTI